MTETEALDRQMEQLEERFGEDYRDHTPDDWFYDGIEITIPQEK